MKAPRHLPGPGPGGHGRSRRTPRTGHRQCGGAGRPARGGRGQAGRGSQLHHRHRTHQDDHERELQGLGRREDGAGPHRARAALVRRRRDQAPEAGERERRVRLRPARLRDLELRRRRHRLLALQGRPQAARGGCRPVPAQGRRAGALVLQRHHGQREHRRRARAPGAGAGQAGQHRRACASGPTTPPASAPRPQAPWCRARTRPPPTLRDGPRSRPRRRAPCGCGPSAARTSRRQTVPVCVTAKPSCPSRRGKQIFGSAKADRIAGTKGADSGLGRRRGRPRERPRRRTGHGALR